MPTRQNHNLWKSGLTLLAAAFMVAACATANDPVIADNDNNDPDSVETDSNRLSLVHHYSTSGYARDLDIRDSLLVIAEDQAGFSIYNLKNDMLISRFNTSELSNIRLIRALDKYLFAYNKYGTSSTGIIAYNIQNPSAPVKIFPIVGDTQDVTELLAEKDPADSGAVLLSWVNDKMLKYNMKFKEFYQGGQQYAFSYPVTGFDRDSLYAYLAYEQRGINIVKMADGTAVGSYDTDGEAIDTRVFGNLLSAALQEAGVIVLDVTDRANPLKLFSYNTTGYAQHLDTDGHYLAVASGGGGVYLFDVSNKNNIRLTGRMKESEIGYAYRVKIAGGFVYAASKTGLYKLKIKV